MTDSGGDQPGPFAQGEGDAQQQKQDGEDIGIRVSRKLPPRGSKRKQKGTEHRHAKGTSYAFRERIDQRDAAAANDGVSELQNGDGSPRRCNAAQQIANCRVKKVIRMEQSTKRQFMPPHLFYIKRKKNSIPVVSLGKKQRVNNECASDEPERDVTPELSRNERERAFQRLIRKSNLQTRAQTRPPSK
jgi:hypothetical protein